MSYQLDPAFADERGLAARRLAELEFAHGALASPARAPQRHAQRPQMLEAAPLAASACPPGLPDPAFATLTIGSPRIARGLAPARDAQALIDAIDKLERRPARARA